MPYASDEAHAAGGRPCRAEVMQPDAAALSFRASCKPLPLGMGFMTPSSTLPLHLGLYQPTCG